VLQVHLKKMHNGQEVVFEDRCEELFSCDTHARARCCQVIGSTSNVCAFAVNQLVPNAPAGLACWPKPEPGTGCGPVLLPHCESRLNADCWFRQTQKKGRAQFHRSSAVAMAPCRVAVALSKGGVTLARGMQVSPCRATGLPHLHVMLVTQLRHVT
jgi:hypothetical protein